MGKSIIFSFVPLIEKKTFQGQNDYTSSPDELAVKTFICVGPTVLYLGDRIGMVES